MSERMGELQISSLSSARDLGFYQRFKNTYISGLIALLTVWCVILFSFRHQVALILEAWETLPSHAHGYVVLLVSVYFLWLRRSFLLNVPWIPSWKGGIALIASGGIAFVGELVSIAGVVQFSLVFMMISSTWAVLGGQAARTILVPLSFLLFAVPFGHEILPYLMDWTADATVIALRASGIPVYQEGRYFVIPSGNWSVIEACGGVRYLLSSIFLGACFAFLTYTRWYKRVLFMVWAVIMPILANWLRAYVIVLVAHISNKEWGLGLSHIALGWVIFGIAIFLGFTVGVRWRDPSPVVSSVYTGKHAGSHTFVIAAVLAAMIPVGWHDFSVRMESKSLRPVPVFNLTGLASLTSADVMHDGIQPTFVSTTYTHEGSYLHEEGRVDVFVAYYRNQHQGAELLNINNSIEPTGDWNWSMSGGWSGVSEKIPPMRFEGYMKGNLHAATLLLYWVNGKTTTNGLVSKLFELMSRLQGKGDDAAAVIITGYSTVSLDTAKSLAESFVIAHLDQLLIDLEHAAASNEQKLN